MRYRDIDTLMSHVKHNFSHLTHKSGQVVNKHMINYQNSIQFPPKMRIMLTLCPKHPNSFTTESQSVQRSSEHLQTLFGNVRKSSENCLKSSEVAGTFSEIPVMTRRKSHAFDSEKVGRYKSAIEFHCNSPQNTLATSDFAAFCQLLWIGFL